MTHESLGEFIEHMTGDEHLRVQDDLGQGYVRLRAAEAQRRQAKQDIRCFEDVVIEMLRNAHDAGARAIFCATWTEGNVRRLTMLDDGSGIPEQLHETVFEPFVTSRLDTFHADRWGVHGRGMALFSIRENVDEAKVVLSKPGLGSVFSVTSNRDTLPEKHDQSRIPSVTKDDAGALVLRGPHNIIRTVLEFAIEHRSGTVVYLGSPTDIAATLFALSSAAAEQLNDLLAPPPDEIPYVQRLGFSFDAKELADEACRLALPLSVRSAHRILKGQIAPLAPHLSILAAQASQSGAVVKGGTRRTEPAFRPSRQDVEALCERVGDAYGDFARLYYLDPDVTVAGQLRQGKLILSIPLRLGAD